MTRRKPIKPIKRENTSTLECQELMDSMQEEFNKQYNSVNHPSHYNTNNPKIKLAFDCAKGTEISIECIDVIRDMPTWKGSAIKYLWREGLKKDASLSDIEKEIEDCEKAIWYIKDHIKQLKNGNKNNE